MSDQGCAPGLAQLVSDRRDRVAGVTAGGWDRVSGFVAACQGHPVSRWTRSCQPDPVSHHHSCPFSSPFRVLPSYFVLANAPQIGSRSTCVSRDEWPCANCADSSINLTTDIIASLRHEARPWAAQTRWKTARLRGPIAGRLDLHCILSRNDQRCSSSL